MYIIYFIYIKYIFHLYGFQVLVLKLLLIENTSFICTNRVNLLCSRSNSDKPVIVAKGFLNLLSLLKLKRSGILFSSEQLVLTSFWQSAKSGSQQK